MSTSLARAEVAPEGAPTETGEVPVLLQINGARNSETAKLQKPAADAPKSLTTEELMAAAQSLSQPGLAQAGTRLAQREAITQSDYGLSTLTIEMLTKWKLHQVLADVDESYKRWQSTKTVADAVPYLLSKQKLIEALTILSFDVRRCTNEVDREIAKSTSKAAYLQELRDKAIRYNTYADFVAGGLTGIVSGALEMGDLSRFSYTTTDIAEGLGQSALSYWAFKAEHAGDRNMGAIPNVLAAIVDPTCEHSAYPETVMDFLNTSPPNGNGKTRADMMRVRWEKMNFCFTHTGHRMKKHHRIKRITGQQKEDATMTIDLLEDRIAMLHDLRAEITTMDESIGELYELMRRY